MGILNLISADNPIIAEQTTVLLANLSHSESFQHYFVSESNIKKLVHMLLQQQKNLHTDVSLLSVLISVLNLSAIGRVL